MGGMFGWRGCVSSVEGEDVWRGEWAGQLFSTATR